MGDTDLAAFVAESNRIEGIQRTTDAEIEAHEKFLALDAITVASLKELVAVLAPGKLLRTQPGMNVQVGNHLPPIGGPQIPRRLEEILAGANSWRRDDEQTFRVHLAYETLHPFMDGNGRSGRALWLWMLNGEAPLGFLHWFYYQTLRYTA